MKDLEKIKSEDLGCQVADANPGNFAIEQEVALLVGATVPAPTEPSADDARELGAQLLVFLRRALLPIRSALRTAVAAIYAHLDSRCTAYTPAAYAPFRILPYDPMGSTPRTLPNLLTALTAFSARKISNGSAPSDGIPDGISLARLVCSSNSDVTKIVDDTTGWTFNNNNMIATLINLYPNCNEFILGCKSVTTQIANMGSNRAIKFILTNCESIILDRMIGQQSSVGGAIPGFPNGEVHIYGLKTTNQPSNTAPSLVIGKAYFHDYERGVYLVNGSATWSIQSMFYIYIGCKGKKTDTIRFWASEYGVNGSVKDVEIREGACQNLTLQNLNGLTAENMYNHILLRLKQNEPNCGSGVTITLGTTNIEKLEAVEEYNTKLTELEDTYGYTFA